MDNVRKLLHFFDRRDKMRAGFLLGAMFIGAILEAVGIGLIMPFIAIINDPPMLQQSPRAARLYEMSGATSADQFLLWCGSGLVLLYIFKNGFLALLSYSLYHFIFNRQVALARRLLAAYLHSPYTFYIQRNSAELLRNVNVEIPLSISQFLIASFILMTEITVIVVILTMLLVIQPLAAMMAIILLGGTASIFYRMLRKRMTTFGKMQQEYSGSMIKWVNQGLGGFKETKVLGREKFFIDAHHRSSSGYAQAMRFMSIASEMPRLFTEVIAIGGLLGIIVIMLAHGQNMKVVIPTLTLFAMSAMRLMPSMNRIVTSLNRIRFFAPSVQVVYKDLVELHLLPTSAPVKASAATEQTKSSPEQPKLTFTREIELRDLCYRYPTGSEDALHNVNLTIPRGFSVAFVGTSGAGKTTIADIILGLLAPASGQVLVDGVDIQTDVGTWQRKMGYIPQPIYLSDDSIRRNVGFGLEDDKIDEERIWQALRSAQLEELVLSLPEGLDTLVGERGLRLSGGQRQRIGIARALYGDPEILIMDEATSALDNATESEITKAIAQFNRSKTVIIIAHRLSTVRDCDLLFFMKNGQLAASGTYDELLKNNTDFQIMVNAV